MSAPRLTPGRLVYLLYHRPLAAVRRSWREGGPVEQFITASGRRAMQRAAERLPSRAPVPADAPMVHFVTGRRFWYQTAYCFWSLREHAAQPLRATFIDDGTFGPDLQREALRLFPGSAVVTSDEIEAKLDAGLPSASFPVLRRRRAEYPNLRKLTDVHVGARGWNLVLDSDMLFFRPPTAMLAALERGCQPLHMCDVQDAYGYSPALLRRLAGQAIPERVNVGVCGLDSENIDWDRLEQWSRDLERAEGTSYYQEQALVAMMLAGKETEPLPRQDYLLMPSDDECRDPTAILHHYVDLSKRGYFRHAWRNMWNP